MTDKIPPLNLLDPAPEAVVRTAARRLGDKLGQVSRQQLKTLIGLMGQDGRIGYRDAYDRLFPDHDRSEADKRADKTFRKFRRTLRDMAAEHRVRLELRPDSRRGADPAHRRPPAPVGRLPVGALCRLGPQGPCEQPGPGSPGFSERLAHGPGGGHLLRYLR